MGIIQMNIDSVMLGLEMTRLLAVFKRSDRKDYVDLDDGIF